MVNNSIPVFNKSQKNVRKIDIFISSPKDVQNERSIASEVIDKLNKMPHIADRYMLNPLAYEEIVPASVGKSPQKTVDDYMMKADKADIFICILWSRMGTPVVFEETGEKFNSGTEYEFITAYHANQHCSMPKMLLYRCTRSFPNDVDFDQAKLVRDFFARFDGKNADLKGLYRKYESRDEFKELLFRDLDKMITELEVRVNEGTSALPEVKFPSVLPEYPEKLREFVKKNRADELESARKYLEDHRILLISGIGGVGKTTLARALVENRPDDVPVPFWFDFSRNKDEKLETLLERLAAYLNAPQILKFKPDKREAGQIDIDLFINELKVPLWFVFDNLETVLSGKNFRDEGIDSLFTSLRGSEHAAKIIITSRTLPELKTGEALVDPSEEEEKQEIKGLRINDAVEFLKKSGLGKIKDEELIKLAERVDGHPLALKLFVGLTKKTSVADIMKDLGKFKKRKEEIIKKTRMLFDRLAGDEKELLERISVYRRPEQESAIKKMFMKETSVDAIDKLIDESLLETDHDGKYWLHPLVREFAYDDLKNKNEMHKLACEYYLSLQLPEKRSGIEDVRHLIEAHHHACEAKEFDRAADIIFDNKMHEDLDRWGNSKTLIELYSRLLPEDIINGKPLLKDKKIHGSVLGNLGLAYSDLGQVEKAIEFYEKGLEIATEIGDRHREGTHLGNLGLAYSALGHVDKAIEYYEKALPITTEIGDWHGEGNHLGNLGLAYSALGQVEKAIEYYEKALAITTEIGDRRNKGTWLGNLGLAYNALGQVEKAIEFYEKALTIATEIGDRRNEGIWIGSLGLAYWALGQVEKAIEYYEKALPIATEIGDRRNEGIWLGNLGLAYSTFGQEEKAIEYYKKALRIATEIGDRRSEGADLGNLGSAYSALGQMEKATEYYEKALTIGKEIKDPRIVNFCKKKLCIVPDKTA